MSDPKRPGENLRALADYAAMAELERIDSLSPEELAAELAAHGLTPTVEDALSPRPVASALPARAFDATSAPTGVPPAAVIALGVGALVVAAVTIALLTRIAPAPPPEPAPRLESPAPVERAPAPSATPVDDHLLVAARLRGDARAACDHDAFKECLDALDRAAALDAAGDMAPDVTRLREKARTKLERKGR